MDDTIGLIQCPDCKSVVEVGFGLLLQRDRVIQMFARCPFCYEVEGDTRDIVGNVRLTFQEYTFAWHTNILIREEMENKS